MAFHSIATYQKIPISLENAWDFFSSPKNLEIITPDHLGFNITSTDVREKMYAGQIITYTVAFFGNKAPLDDGNYACASKGVFC